MGVSPEERLDAKFRKRIKRRLYYGDMAGMDAPSLPLTELAVDYFHDTAPGKLGHVDLELASNIVRENKVTPCSMVVSVLYARRLRQRSKQYLETMSSSDIFFISMMMASKYMYDEGTDDEVYNDEWAVSIDQDVCDVNKMEMDFLQAMDWGLFVQPEEFDHVLNLIEKRLALQEGLKRGWFTYAELDVLMGPDLIGWLWQGVGAECSKLMATISAAYLTGLLGMIGSVALAAQVSTPLSHSIVGLIAQHSSPLLGAAPNVLPLEQHSRLHLCSRSSANGHCWNLGDELEPDAVADENATFPDDRGVPLSPSQESGSMRESRMFQDAGPAVAENKVMGAQGREENETRAGYGETPLDESGPSARPLVQPVATSSLWSLWLLDTMLSQIISLSSFKSQAPPTSAACRSKQCKRFASGQGVQGIHEASVEASDDLLLGEMESSTYQSTAYPWPARSFNQHHGLDCSRLRHFRSTRRRRRPSYQQRAQIWQGKPDCFVPDTVPELACEPPSPKGGGTPGFLSSLLHWPSSWIGSGKASEAENVLHHKSFSDSRASSPIFVEVFFDVCGNHYGHAPGFKRPLPSRASGVMLPYTSQSWNPRPGQHSEGGGGTGQVHPHHGDDQPTKAPLLHAPSSFISGIYRMLQVA